MVNKPGENPRTTIAEQTANESVLSDGKVGVSHKRNLIQFIFIQFKNGLPPGL
jgi:hypothetical protein